MLEQPVRLAESAAICDAQTVPARGPNSMRDAGSPCRNSPSTLSWVAFSTRQTAAKVSPANHCERGRRWKTFGEHSRRRERSVPPPPSRSNPAAGRAGRCSGRALPALSGHALRNLTRRHAARTIWPRRSRDFDLAKGNGVARTDDHEMRRLKGRPVRGGRCASALASPPRRTRAARVRARSVSRSRQDRRRFRRRAGRYRSCDRERDRPWR